jgi:hypothetical protein
MRPLLVYKFASHWFGIFIFFYVSFWLNNRRATGNNWFCDSFHSVTTNAGFSEDIVRQEPVRYRARQHSEGSWACLHTCVNEAAERSILVRRVRQAKTFHGFKRGIFSSDTGIVDSTWELYRPQNILPARRQRAGNHPVLVLMPG